jgi:RNA recognition motif-containing protein
MIIRNLVFDINEKHIQKLLAPYGKILEVNIPKNPDNKGSRGFAFVEF